MSEHSALPIVQNPSCLPKSQENRLTAKAFQDAY